jgi:glycosyltransferase involved in cell wall biosynthesis
MSRKIAIVPAYNEAKHLRGVLETFGARMDMVIAVNDGSRDATPSILAQWVAGQPRAYAIDNAANAGKASALKDGFTLAALLMREKIVAPDDLLYTFDADGQHTEDSIDHLAEMARRDQLDMLLTRRDFSHYPGFKKVGNWGLSLGASILGGYRYGDVECGLRVIKMEKIPELLAYYTGHKYSCEQELGVIAARLRYRIDNSYLVEVPYYRTGTKVPDGIVNLSLGVLACARVLLGLRTSMDSLTRRLQGKRILAGPDSPLPAALRSAPARAAGAALPARPTP